VGSFIHSVENLIHSEGDVSLIGGFNDRFAVQHEAATGNQSRMSRAA